MGSFSILILAQLYLTEGAEYVTANAVTLSFHTISACEKELHRRIKPQSKNRNVCIYLFALYLTWLMYSECILLNDWMTANNYLERMWEQAIVASFKI
jgi:hypothetical protein